MLDHLLKPKWQHSDPRKRQAALESGTLPPEALATVAREDSDQDVRCSAILRVDDPDLLAGLLQEDLVDQVREMVVQRQSELLSRPLELAPSLEKRLAIIDKFESTDLCGRLVRNAEAAEIRTAALEQVTDTPLLCAVAVDDAVASVRQKALERINEPEGWEIVSRNARKKDKKISRAARQRLDSFHQAISDQKAAERLCRDMDNLLAAGSLASDSKVMFHRLGKQWQDITSPIPAQLSERFNQARRLFTPRIEAFEAQISARRAVCGELDALLDRIQQAENDNTDFSDELATHMKTLDDRWQATDPHLNSDNPVTHRFSDLQLQLRQASERLDRDRQRMIRLQKLISSADTLMLDPDKLNENRINQLQLRWSKLDKPESRHLAQMLQNEFEASLQRSRKHLKQRTQQRRKAIEEAEQLLTELQTALSHGELERALSLRDRINHRLKLAHNVEKKRQDTLQKQLNQLRVKLDELRQWRHWGSDNAREHLFTEIEALIDSTLSKDEVAARVRSARKAWQRIDHAEGPADDALWQRFDQACTRAYEPYQQQRKQQKALLNQHLTQKRKLLAELRDFESNTDWDKVDWREAEQHIHGARERWRRIGSIPRKAGKPLEKDYRDVLDLLESRLAPERNRELKRRRALISRVEELSRASDLRSASREVKAAQDQWKPTVPLPRREEQALWQQFRSACDAVFDQLRKERISADAEREANLERRQAICAELESLLDQPKKTFREIHQQFAATRDEWSQLRNVPRKQERAIDARYESIKQRLAERQRQEAKTAAEARLLSIREYSRICTCLEQEVLDQTMDEAARQTLLSECSHSRQALPEFAAQDAKPLQARYELATRALQGDGGAQASLRERLAKNLQQRLQLCLQLEVATGIDSPAEHADERMKYQVSLLADAMQHKHTDEESKEDRLTALEIAWLQAGPVNQQERGKLTERFERALSAGKGLGNDS
ncbi:MAG: DUF349 domain-containing protein [Gammaproteobacteria bacterium]